MADWLRMLRNDDEIEIHPSIESELRQQESQPYLSSSFREDVARIASLFIIASLLKIFFLVVGVFKPSWLTALVEQVGFDSLIIVSCSFWIVAGGRFFSGIAITAVVVLLQLLLIGGLIDRNTLEIGRALALDAISLSLGALLGLFFRR